jgi:hypothetical protein
MNDPRLNLPRYNTSAEIPRAIVFYILWATIGFVALNLASQHRTLECEKPSGIVQCHLIDKSLTGESHKIEFEGAKLQQAIVKQSTNIGPRSTLGRGEVTLITTQGDFWLTAADNVQSDQKYQIVEKINTFLGQPQLTTLKVDPGYNAIFWIGSGVYIVLSILYCLPLALALLAAREPAPTKSVHPQPQTAWGKNLEKFEMVDVDRRVQSDRSADSTID